MRTSQSQAIRFDGLTGQATMLCRNATNSPRVGEPGGLRRTATIVCPSRRHWPFANAA